MYFYLYTDICWLSQLDHEFILGKNYVYPTHPKHVAQCLKKKKKSTSQINIELKYVSSLEEMREEDSINLPLHEA